MADVFFSKTRIDVMVHRSTRWFSEREHGLRLQCQCANQAGILERSVASMARFASGDGQVVNVSPADIEASIARLVNTGHVVWFREFEVLWWVEMADEQQPPEESGRAKFWNQIRTQLLPKLVNQVRVAICARYPELGSGKPSESCGVGTDSGTQLGLLGSLDRDQDSDQDQDRENRSRRSATSKRSRRKPRAKSAKAAVDPSLVDQVIGCFNEHRVALIDNAVGFRSDSACHRRAIEKATRRERASFDDWRERIARLAEAASRDPFWLPHLTPEHLHWAKNWEKWAHDSAIPPLRAPRPLRHVPSSFDGPDQSFGIDFGDEGTERKGGSDAA